VKLSLYLPGAAKSKIFDKKNNKLIAAQFCVIGAEIIGRFGAIGSFVYNLELEL
jgi:hypothetical protein